MNQIPPDTRTLDEFRADTAAEFADMVDLLTRKRESYGTGNLVRRGLLGIVFRMEDKVDRLFNLVQRGENASADGDTMIDAWRDVMGYAVLGLMYYRSTQELPPRELGDLPAADQISALTQMIADVCDRAGMNTALTFAGIAAVYETAPAGEDEPPQTDHLVVRNEKGGYKRLDTISVRAEPRVQDVATFSPTAEVDAGQEISGTFVIPDEIGNLIYDRLRAGETITVPSSVTKSDTDRVAFVLTLTPNAPTFSMEVDEIGLDDEDETASPVASDKLQPTLGSILPPDAQLTAPTAMTTRVMSKGEPEVVHLGPQADGPNAWRFDDPRWIDCAFNRAMRQRMASRGFSAAYTARALSALTGLRIAPAAVATYAPPARPYFHIWAQAVGLDEDQLLARIEREQVRIDEEQAKRNAVEAVERP